MSLRVFLNGALDSEGHSTLWCNSDNGERGYFTIYCGKCHNGLCQNIEIGDCHKRGHRHNVIVVYPCPFCEKARAEGVEVKVEGWPGQYREGFRDPRDAVQKDQIGKEQGEV